MVECCWIKASESTRHLFLKEHFVLALFIHAIKKTMRKIAYMRSDRRDSYFNVVENEVVGTDVDEVELSLFLNIAKRLGFNVGYL